jgi:uncharacterized membrane protein YgcG
MTVSAWLIECRTYREHPICASGAGYAPPPPTRTKGEKALIWRAQSARKMSALNEKMHKWDAPYLPLTLSLNGQLLNVEGLLDTGASVNVLPYKLGQQLGLIWENETLSVVLAGNLARFEARAVIVDAQVSSFPKFDLAFAWTRSTVQYKTKLLKPRIGGGGGGGGGGKQAGGFGGGGCLFFS